jgi:hypothetical protein
MKSARIFAPFAVVLTLAAAAGCGSSSSTPSTTPSGSSGTSPTSTPPATLPQGSSSGAGALVAESQQAAAGDIPDNQVFLVYRDAKAGYSIKYPEGWAIRGTAGDVTIQDKNNVVHIVADTAAATMTQANADMKSLAALTPRFSFKPPVPHPTCTNMGTTVKLPLASVHVVYTTQGKTDPVTGKRAVLNVDRYYLAHNGGRVIVDLGTPQGVDNVDAYCLMIASFRWK